MIVARCHPARGARLVLALYLVVYLAAAAPLTSAVWARGGHVTIAQVALHQQFLQRGFLDHHQEPAGARADPDTRMRHTLMALLSTTTPVLTTVPPPPFFPESLLLAVAGLVVLLLLPAAWHRSRATDEPCLPGLRPAPPRRPPKPHRSFSLPVPDRHVGERRPVLHATA